MCPPITYDTAQPTSQFIWNSEIVSTVWLQNRKHFPRLALHSKHLIRNSPFHDYTSCENSNSMLTTYKMFFTHILTPGGGSHTHSPVVKLAYICSFVLGSIISTHSHLQNKHHAMKIHTFTPEVMHYQFSMVSNRLVRRH